MTHEITTTPLPIQGRTIVRIEPGQEEQAKHGDITRVRITMADGTEWMLFHAQDCCERVWLADVTGDVNDLLGLPLLVAEERVQKGPPLDEDYGTSTWTFYDFRTVRGSVTLRWIGESNGYYSERVELFNPEADAWRRWGADEAKSFVPCDWPGAGVGEP